MRKTRTGASVLSARARSGLGYRGFVRIARLAVVLVAVALLAAGASLAAGAKTGFGRALVVRGLDSPLQVTAPRSEPRRLYVVEQRGTIRVVERGKLRPGFFLDVRSSVTAGGEQGLLGLAFDPRYTSNRFVYVNYTDRQGDTQVVRFRTNGSRVLPATARRLLRVDQPYANHNGGNLAFGPDGYLYVGLGDGGSAGDPEDRAQNMSSPLGKMLRLNVRRPGSAPQIVALGLRNPWRYSFDRATGDLYIGDVGQNEVEEIDFTPRVSPGLENYGWSALEGTRPYKSESLGPGALVSPIYEYTHARGCSVTGGFVYRGSARPAQRGRYVFGDYCSGTVWSLRVVGGKATAVRVEPFTIPSLASFGEDASGELYATSLQGMVYRLS
jgi:glucose/arabinose dehydrogenase